LSNKLRTSNQDHKYDCESSANGSDELRYPTYQPKKITGGKQYFKKLVSISDTSCILAVRRLTSIRQQSDQLLSIDTSKQLAASPSAAYPVFRKRKKCRKKASDICGYL